MVLAHGAALSQVGWRGLGYVEALADKHRVITVDLHGQWRSAKPHSSQRYFAERIGDDILVVLDDAEEESSTTSASSETASLLRDAHIEALAGADHASILRETRRVVSHIEAFLLKNGCRTAAR